MVHVLGEPPTDWSGEHGVINLDVMRRHLPSLRDGLHFFVCGPSAMIQLVEQNLHTLGLPLQRLHSEIFDLC